MVFPTPDLPDDDNDDLKPLCIDASVPTSAPFLSFLFLYDSSITQTLSLAHDDDIWPPLSPALPDDDDGSKVLGGREYG